MTRQEFIQEAALRLISAMNEYTITEVASWAKELAKEIYGEEEEEPEIPYSNEPISAVIKEIDRMDCEERDANNAKLPLGTPWRYNKRGHARIAQTACERESILTVAGLLAFGRSDFLGIYNIGPKVIKSVDKALENLYNIQKW